MAVRNVSAPGSAFRLGRQTAYGTPITRNADMVAKAYPIESNTIQLQAAIEESSLITSLGADSANELGKLSSSGDLVVGLMVDDMVEFYRAILNPASVTTSAVTVATTDHPMGTAGAISTGNQVISTTARADGTIPNIPSVQDSRSTTAKYEFPCRVNFTFAGSTFAAGAQIAYTGRQARGINRNTPGNRPFINKVIPAATGTNTYRTPFLAEFTSYEITGITGGTVAITYEPATNFVELELQATDPQFPGWTAMPTVGFSPILIYDLIPNSMTISGDNTGYSATFNCLGGQIEPYRTVEGGLNTERLTLQAADNTYYAAVDTRVMSGWAGALNYNGETLPYNSLDVTFNRNLEFPGTVTGDGFERDPTASRSRQFTFACRIPYRAGDAAGDVFPRWQEIFSSDQRNALYATTRNYGSDGRVSQMEFEAPVSQITTAPGLPVSGPGLVEIPVEFKGLATATQTSECTIRIWQATAIT